MDSFYFCGMKKLPIVLFLSLLFFYSCTTNEEDLFECSVDYVEFLDAQQARVQFEVSYEGTTRYYTVELPYTETDGGIAIGDEIVRIENFTARGNTATFDFYYGQNLGGFCADLFTVLPEHTHLDFYAEAERELDSRAVGKWKIKRSRSFQ